MAEISADILALEQETEGLRSEITKGVSVKKKASEIVSPAVTQNPKLSVESAFNIEGLKPYAEDHRGAEA